MAYVVSLFVFLIGCTSESDEPQITPAPTEQPRPESGSVLPPVATEYSSGPTDCPTGTLPVPGGRVVLGQEGGDAGRDEQPVHTVLLDGFCLDRTEMVESKGGRSRLFDGWASAREAGVARGGRLPTEAEFEKAARGGCELGSDPKHCDEGDMRIYPWGNAAPTCGLANHSMVSHRGPQRCSDGPGDAAAIAEGAGPYGHLNLAGNLWEPMEDWYHPKVYRTDRPKNPGGPTEGRSKTLRGGAWDTFSTNMRISNRFSDHIKGSSIGARCVFGGGTPTAESVDPLEWVDVQLLVRMKSGDSIRGRWLTVTAFNETDMDRSGLPKPGISPLSEGGAVPNGTRSQTVSLAVPKGDRVRFSAALDSGKASSGPMPAAASGGIGWAKQGVVAADGMSITVVVAPLPSHPHSPRP